MPGIQDIFGILGQAVISLNRIATILSSGLINLSSNNTFTGNNTFDGGLLFPPRVVTAAGAVTVLASDFIIVVNKTVGAATTVNLPASPTTGMTFIIKDGKGDSLANPITITPAAGTIDGQATLVIFTNYQRACVNYNGTEWNQIF